MFEKTLSYIDRTGPYISETILNQIDPVRQLHECNSVKLKNTGMYPDAKDAMTSKTSEAKHALSGKAAIQQLPKSQ